MMNQINSIRLRAILSLVGLCALFGVINCGRCSAAIALKSPDGKIAVTITTGDHLKYAVTFHGKTVIEPSALEDGH